MSTKNMGGRKPGTWGEGLSPDVLRSFRANGSVSRARMAKLLGVSATTIQNWETGLGVPTPKNQEQLRAVFKAGVPEATRASFGANLAPGVGAAVGEATGKIVTGYLATNGGVTVEKLCELIKAVRGALL